MKIISIISRELLLLIDIVGKSGSGGVQVVDPDSERDGDIKFSAQIEWNCLIW